MFARYNFHSWFDARRGQLLILALVFIVGIAAILRLWNLSENVMFQGDQGRDSLIVARIFTEGDFVFIGPVTSVGNMYLGPLYYYFMVPFLWLTYPSPLGPVYAVAMMGILTVWLVYKLGKEMIGQAPALLAALMYALSSIAIITTRFSWNPNPVPLVSLLTIYWIFKAYRGKLKYWTLVLIGIAILIQLHYMTLLAAATAGLLWIIQLVSLVRSGDDKKFKQIRQMLLFTGVGAVGLAISLIPLMLFDYRHNWLNLKAFSEILGGGENIIATAEQASADSRIIKILKESHGRSMHILFEMFVGQVRRLNTIMVLVTIGLLANRLFIKRDKTKLEQQQKTGLFILTTFLLMGILGTSLYEHTVFDHYIAYLLPVSTLILGWVLVKIIYSVKVGWLIAVAFLVFFGCQNIKKYPMLLSPSEVRIKDIQQISDSILARVDEDDIYNIVLLSETGDIDGMKYRYFLEASDKPPVRTESRGETNKLFIINEDRKLKRVVDSPVYEIVVFPNKEPFEVYDIPGWPEITVLEKAGNSE